MGAYKDLFIEVLGIVEGMGVQAGMEAAERTVVPVDQAQGVLDLLDENGEPVAGTGGDLLRQPDEELDDCYIDGELWKVADRALRAKGGGALGPMPKPGSLDRMLLDQLREEAGRGFDRGMRRGLVRQARVLLRMEPWQQPAAQADGVRGEVVSALVVHASHLPGWAATNLDQYPGVLACGDSAYGWWMWVPDDPMGDNCTQIQDGGDPVPWEILVVQMYARDLGCSWVRYDRGGERVASLPWWDW